MVTWQSGQKLEDTEKKVFTCSSVFFICLFTVSSQCIFSSWCGLPEHTLAAVFVPPPTLICCESSSRTRQVWVSKEGKDQSKQKERHPLMALMGLSASSGIMLAVLIILPYLSVTVAQFKVQPCAESQCFFLMYWTTADLVLFFVPLVPLCDFLSWIMDHLSSSQKKCFYRLLVASFI